jgi:hypothetical protein
MRKADDTSERQYPDSNPLITADDFSRRKVAISPYDYQNPQLYIFSLKPEGYDATIVLAVAFPKPSIDQERDLQYRQPFQSVFDCEQRAFIRMLPDLLKTLSGQYVAVLGGEVIDQDSNEIKLAERVESNHRSEFVLIRKVSQEQTADYLESPEEELP